jgi:hypothetical protein
MTYDTYNVNVLMGPLGNDMQLDYEKCEGLLERNNDTSIFLIINQPFDVTVRGETTHHVTSNVSYLYL